MNKRNPLLFIVILAALIGGVLLFSLYNLKELEHRLRLQKEEELELKTAELLQKEASLTELENEKTRMEKNLAGKISALEEEIAVHKENQKALSLKVEELEGEREAIKSDNLAKQKNIEELAQKISGLETDKSDLLKTIGQLKASLEKGSRTAPQAQPGQNEAGEDSMPSAGLQPASVVELGQIVVQKSSGSAARVQHVNKVYGFVVLTAGSKDGLRPDLTVNIIRDNRLIAKAVIQKVRSTTSAAILLPGQTFGEIRAGDLVSVA